MGLVAEFSPPGIPKSNHKAERIVQETAQGFGAIRERLDTLETRCVEETSRHDSALAKLEEAMTSMESKPIARFAELDAKNSGALSRIEYLENVVQRMTKHVSFETRQAEPKTPQNAIQSGNAMRTHSVK